MLNNLLKWLMNLLFKTTAAPYDSIEQYEEVRKIEKEEEKKHPKRKWICRISQVILIITIFIIGYFIIGCAPITTETRYVYVDVPVKCDVDVPQKPTTTNNVIKDNLLILQYAEKLKITLLKCI